MKLEIVYHHTGGCRSGTTKNRSLEVVLVAVLGVMYNSLHGYSIIAFTATVYRAPFHLGIEAQPESDTRKSDALNEYNFTWSLKRGNAPGTRHGKPANRTRAYEGALLKSRALSS